MVGFGLAVLVPALHHHEDGQVHETCLLCFYIAHHSDIVPQDDQPVFLSYGYLPSSLELFFTFPSTFHSRFLIRAPPA